MSVRSFIVGVEGSGGHAFTIVGRKILAVALFLPLAALSGSAAENAASEASGSNQTQSSSVEPPAGKETQAQAPAGAGNVSVQVINLPPRVTPSQNAPTAKPTDAQSAMPDKKKTAPKAKGKGTAEKRRGTPPCLTWIDPEVEPRAVLLCVHGLGLYNGTYEPFGKRMAKLGIATYAIDMRGFGSWMEAKGRELVDFESALADVKAVLRVIRRAHPGLPVFLLGESMGGAIALQSTAQFPEYIDGLISSVPAGDRFQQKRTALKVAINLLKNPDRPMNVGTGVIEKATEKPELRESWSKDPLASLNISPRELVQFQAFMNQNHAAAKKIKTTPVLIIQGCRDRLVRPEGTVELYNELATPDRQLMLMPGSEHLVFEEGQFTDDVVDKTLGWINSHLTSSPP